NQPAERDTAATSPLPATVPNVQNAPTTGYRIQLGALGTRALAESSWASLREQHSDLLGNMNPSYENITRGDKTITRLRAGYASSALAARSLCAQLIKRGQECIVVTR
ncbi:MAG: SPOR domain-containing protein, partial [Fimbriimonadaceae bacterium]|nr:SPOR domain-containing protein [Alphaproteobacteria bacterium]